MPIVVIYEGWFVCISVGIIEGKTVNVDGLYVGSVLVHLVGLIVGLVGAIVSDILGVCVGNTENGLYMLDLYLDVYLVRLVDL